jgi:hypothetical protein
LAYYESAVALGLLAPRGWSCFGVYGPDGSLFFVTPEPIDENNPFPLADITGPVVEISTIEGQSSGRFEVAEVIARVFPKHLGFVRDMIDMFPSLVPDIQSGPYQNDKLIYRSDEMVEYATPPYSSGLGTFGVRIQPNDEPIEGVAILQGSSPDLLLLSVRLPPEMQALTSQIIQQLEREAGEQRGR